MTIGSHVSIKNGLKGAVLEALSYNANTFMVYTGAPQNTIRKDINTEEVKKAHELMKENNIEKFVVHAPYIINLASPKEETYTLAKEFLEKEILRTIAFGTNLLVLHPGAFTQSSLEEGIERIVDGLNEVLKEDMDIIICLETMAGKGTEIGRNFNELKQIIDKVIFKDKIGVCVDTCHIHDSGYNITDDFSGVMAEFDQIIGLEKIKLFHINGSLNVRGAKKDRHANINYKSEKGIDNIGALALKCIVGSEICRNVPLILETPWITKTENRYKEEIEFLRGE